MTIKICLFLIFISSAQAAQNHLYIMGAGGEEKGETTNFDQDISSIAKFSTSSRWPATVALNGGHSKTESLINSNFSGAKVLGDFNASNFDKMISELEKKILDKNIKKGEQLLIMIDSHGAIAKPLEISHSVSLTNSAVQNLNTLEGSSTVSLDKLKKVINLATEYGIKLAVIDDSCHSGSSLKLGNADTCIISTTGDKHFGFASVDKNNLTFGGRFYKEMKNGKNLEELFLKARTGNDPDFPMISTDNGKDIQKMMYDLITPYLYYDELSSQKFIDEYFDNNKLKNIDNVICKKDQQFNELMSVVGLVSRNKSLTGHLAVFDNLKKKLQEYRTYQRNYESSVARMLPLYLAARDKITKKYPAQLPKSDFELDSMFMTNYDFLIDNKDKFNFSAEKVAFFNQQKKIKADILGGFTPEMAAVLEKRKVYVKEQVRHKDESRNLASEISAESKKVYKMLYESNMNPKKSNPCRDFVL